MRPTVLALDGQAGRVQSPGMSCRVVSTQLRSRRWRVRRTQYTVLATATLFAQLVAWTRPGLTELDVSQTSAFVPARTIGHHSGPSRPPHAAASTDSTVYAAAATPAWESATLNFAALVAMPVVLRQLSSLATKTHRGQRTRRAAAERKEAAATTVVDKQEASEMKKNGEEEEEPFFEEVSGDDPLVKELEQRLREMNGNQDLTLDMVLNPGTIVNVEREIILLKAELKATPEDEAEKRKTLEDTIEQKQMKVVNEMRQVMTDSLKLEFLLQAALSVPLFASFVYGTWPFIPDLAWLGFKPAFTLLVLKLLGLWGPWLVTVPALRARKPGGPYGMGYEEKRALDISFLLLPFITFGSPFFTKDPTVPFWLSLIVVVLCYLWSFNTPLVADQDRRVQRRGVQDLSLPEPLMWTLKALDFSTGSERGARSEDTEWQSQLDEYEKAAEELVKAKQSKKAEKEAAKKESQTAS